MKKLLLSLWVVSWISVAKAQNFYEALRYSQTQPGGTARGLATGSAFGALGGDYTSVGINPGGLGIYRNSEFFISLNINNTVSQSNFGNSSSESKVNFHPASYGMVYSLKFADTKKSVKNAKWIGMNFAVGMNRIANFNSERHYENYNDAESLLPILASELNGLNPDEVNYENASFESVLAYATYLVNPTFFDSTLYNSVTDGQEIGKMVSVNTRGRMDELALAAAANYNDKLYFGATLGIPFVNYEEDIFYTEFDKDNANDGFDNFHLDHRLRTWGSGVNLKLGAVYRASDWVRIGAALHTPTLLGLNDNYFAYMESDIDTVDYADQSPDGRYNYRIITPLKAVGSLAFIIKQNGFISVDYEYADFSKSHYNLQNGYQSYETTLNNSINSSLNATHTVRVGAEAVIKKDFRLRAGYNYSTNPLSTTIQNAVPEDDRTYQSFSGGAGYRGKKFNLDFAYVRSTTDNSVMLANTIVSADKLTRNNYVLTFGIRF